MTPSPARSSSQVAGLGLAALGIVFGDIGTSPLYTFQTVIALAGGNPAPQAALGLLSLIIWTLLIITAVKYVGFVMRVDNDGEGGILALISLLGVKNKHRPWIVAIGLFGAALIYGDGAITPPISVLSAVEGLKMAAPSIAPYILPITVGILVVLFAVQYHGTARIGWVFGPVMALWFVVIGALGLHGVLLHPGVLAALNPYYGLHYLATGGYGGFLVLGGVFLCVTGAEALYADMGHIGARPIRLAWYGLVLPALLLNYAGQTALLLGGEVGEDNIFYKLCPPPLLMPLVGLSTVATIIASQSIITGAFSMTRQAIQLGWCPHLTITQTSATGYGQIYVRAVNWMLAAATIGLALAFGSSTKLAAAYGIAVSLTMLLTSLLLVVAMREIWRWGWLRCLLVAGLFIIVDLTFFSANLMKLADGGWVPLALAALIYLAMTIWHRGKAAMAAVLNELTEPVAAFMSRIAAAGVARVPGGAVFITQTSQDMPPIIVWHVRQNKSLHRKVVALWVVTAPVPHVDPDQQLTISELAPDFWRTTVHYGFMDNHDLPVTLAQAAGLGCAIDPQDVTYYVGLESIRHSKDHPLIPKWQESLFALMRRNSCRLADFLNLPQDRVMEIGRRIEI